MKKYTDIILDALKGRRFETILEMGCGAGHNLKVIKEKYPKTKLWGYDIDETRVEEAKKIPDTIVEIGDFTEKETPFKDKKFDIVLMMATLIYISPEKMIQTMENIKKSAKKEVILIEIHSLDRIIYKIYFLRDYERLLKENGFKNIKLKKIPRWLWPGLNYKDDGYIISAEI